VKLDRETALELMALADGELEGEAEERALKRVATDAHAREAARQMRDERAGDWLRRAMNERAAAAGADGVADAVFARLEGSKFAASPGEAADMPSARMSGRSRASRRGLPVSWSRVQSAIGATLTLSLAAGIAFYLATRPPASPLGPASPVSQVAAASMGGGGVEVDELDAPAHDISVFEISGGGGAIAANQSPSSSVVIWIEDEPGAQ
jgi:hypothetical protein